MLLPAPSASPRMIYSGSRRLHPKERGWVLVMPLFARVRMGPVGHDPDRHERSATLVMAVTTNVSGVRLYRGAAFIHEVFSLVDERRASPLTFDRLADGFLACMSNGAAEIAITPKCPFLPAVLF
jgi:hypothetical protein